jgi:hypothetical protein
MNMIQYYVLKFINIVNVCGIKVLSRRNEESYHYFTY